MARQTNRLKVAGRDAVWLQESPENLMVIHAVFLLDRMELETLQGIFQSRILDADDRFPRFKRRVVLDRGRPFWEETPAFDLTDHIFLAPPVADDPEALFGGERLQEHVASMASVPLPDDRPLWQLQFIPRYAEDKSAFYVRMHHVMADGMSLLPVIFSLMDREEGDAADLEREARAMNKPPSSFWRITKTVLAGPFLLLQKLLWRPDRNLLHGPELSGKKRVVWTPSIEVERVKEVKNACGCTLNDVLMACVLGAVERYVAGRDVTGSSGQALPRLRMSMPINVRSVEELPKMENKFAAVLLSLPVGKDSPRARVEAMKENLSRLKRSIEPLFTYGTVRLMLAALPLALSRLLIDFLANKCTAVISNVPGPRREVYLAGKRLRAMLFWVPQRAAVGLGISIMSFADQLRLGVMADTALVPDPHDLVDAFDEELRELRESLGLAKG